jgi:hypothetical protein
MYKVITETAGIGQEIFKGGDRRLEADAITRGSGLARESDLSVANNAD